MAFPLAPANGQKFTEAANGRRWVYDGAKSAWVPSDRVSLDDFDDVDITTTAPAEDQPLVFDGTNWVPQNAPVAGAFVPLVESTANPVDGMTNAKTAGTVWRNTTTQRGWISSQFADANGLRVIQSDTPTNPNGTLAWSNGSIWGINFICANSVTINSIGLYITSAPNSATSVQGSLFSGFNAATLLSGSTANAPGTFRLNEWADCQLTNEVTLIAGNQYSVTFTTVNGDHFVGHAASSVLYPSAFDGDGNGDATSAALIAAGIVPSIRVGYQHSTPGTVWWPIAPFVGDGIVAVDRLATPPAAPVDGQVYYNTTISALFVYDSDNANWIQCLN